MEAARGGALSGTTSGRTSPEPRPQRRSRRWSRWWLSVAASILTGAVVCGIAEVTLRRLVPPTDIGLFEHSAQSPRHKVMKRGLRGHVHGVPFETNAQGFRDTHDWVPRATADELRVVVLGDSMTVSAGVRFEDVYPERLERRLASICRGRRVQVFNVAVGGYDVVQYRQLLEEVGTELEPDLILVGLYPGNDFDSSTRRQSEQVAHGTVSPSGESRWLDNLYVYRWIGRKVEYRLRRLFARVRGTVPETTESVPAEVGWRENTAALLEIVARAGEEKVPVFILLLPYTSGFDVQRVVHAPVRAFCAARGLEYLDLLDVFLSPPFARRNFRVNPLDDHPSAEYHEIVTDAVVEFLWSRWSCEG